MIRALIMLTTILSTTGRQTQHSCQTYILHSPAQSLIHWHFCPCAAQSIGQAVNRQCKINDLA